MLSFGEDGRKSVELDNGMAWVLCGMASRGIYMPVGSESQFDILIGDYGHMLDSTADYGIS
jgi:hypothetical protein